MLVVPPAHSAAVDADKRPLDELGENPNDAAGTDVGIDHRRLEQRQVDRSTDQREALKHGQLGVVEQGDRALHHAVDEFARQPVVVEALGAEAVSEIGQRDLGGLARREFDPQRVTPDCTADRDDRRSGGIVVRQRCARGRRVRDEARHSGPLGIEVRGTDDGLDVQAEGDPIGDQDGDGRAAAVERGDDVGGLVGDVVDPVEHDQSGTTTSQLADHVLEGVCVSRRAERRRQSGDHLTCITHAVAGDHPPTAVEVVPCVGGKGGGEARLADAARPDDGDDGPRRHLAAKRGQFVLASEQWSLSTVLCRTLRLGADDREMEVDRLAVRRDAELGCQCAPAVLEGAQRCRAIARGGKGGDQLAVRLLTERVVLDRPTSEVDGLVEATEGAGRRRGHLQGAVARPFDACAIARDPLGVEIRQQRVGETFERFGGQLDRRIRIAMWRATRRRRRTSGRQRARRPCSWPRGGSRSPSSR